ncbi:MAG: CZB domain-containing protein [Bacteroidales bacterium]|nr:CZB domain-containing protein [Bacteroidales bacterium]MBN2756033.1 CZB domain-containing protein [Bacteroidales bacterium]
MKWKDLKLRNKFFIAFGSIIAILIIISAFSINGINEIITNGNEVIGGNRIKSNIIQKDLDHLKWVNQVSQFLNDDNVSILDVEMDSHKCKFGQFYYGEERKLAEKLVPELKPIFEKIEDPHSQLHKSAKDISDIFEQADKKISIRLMQVKAEHLNWLNKVNKAITLNNSNIDVEADATKCNFALWLNDIETVYFLNKNPEYAQKINSILEPHRKLHESVIEIEKLLANNNRNAAIYYYENNTTKYADEVFSKLEEIIAINNSKLEKMNMANKIFVEKTLPSLEKVSSLFNELHSTVNQKIMSEDVMINEAQLTKKELFLFVIIAALIAFAIAYYLTNNIVKPINESVAFAKKISAGDLTNKLNINQKDEIGELSSALNEMVANLKEMITNVVNGSKTIAQLSNEMSDTSQNMAQGNHEQSSSTEEISATIEELSANTQQNADNAIETKAIALKSTTEIEEGGKAVIETVNAMKIIADKIAVINEIANRTNMLALNAAVEAARAGKYGDGFSVVASEVKQLADKSLIAAEEIDRVAAKSVGIAENTLNIFKAIVPNIKKTATLVQEIAAASMEQNSGTAQISNAIDQLNQITQQNAATSEEMATSSEELASQADYLNDVVSFFNVGDI